MSDREFKYGGHAGLPFVGFIASVIFSVALILFLNSRANDPTQAWGGLFHEWVDWIVAAIAVMCIGLVVRSVLDLGRAEDERSFRLALTDTGIDYRAKTLFARDTFVAYGEIKKVEIFNEEGSVELKIKHAGGSLTLHRWWFDNRSEFDEFASMVAARSGQHLKRGWFT
ncbi:MAG: hypothetical protein KDK10_03145 [Maritimibacter sp.]|nr:hypothetical protein [Maritimibacter sp.]